MTLKARQHSNEEHDYVGETSLRCPPQMAELVAATENMERSGMATGPVQGQFLAFLIKAIGAKRVLEIGVFTGVGTLWMADAAGPEGRIVACDVSAEYPAVGQPHWEKAGVAQRIDLRIGPAAETLQQLVDQGNEPFDFCYIDADKGAYDTYYELSLKLMRQGGIIALDNMLMQGRVTDPDHQDASVQAIQTLNHKLHHDERIDLSFLMIGDGLSLARKR